jgi:hypothetical protein
MAGPLRAVTQDGQVVIPFYFNLACAAR